MRIFQNDSHLFDIKFHSVETKDKVIFYDKQGCEIASFPLDIQMQKINDRGCFSKRKI